jgi:hypothetical protein
VDVPDELVARALAFARAKEEFDRLVKRFEDLVR